MSFSKRLCALRRENKMTQQDVANRLNVARSTVAGYETKNRQPSHEKLTALASIFQVSVDYLLHGDNAVTISTTPLPPEPVTDRNLVERYRKLSVESRKDALAYIQLLELRDKYQK